MAKPVKTNYLSNKEILSEIHKSKISYCSLINPDYQDEKYKYYDIIVNDLSEIDDEVIQYAKEIQAQRKYKKLREELLEMDFSSHEIRLEPDPSKVKTEDIVFRVMTNEHIPLDETKKKKKTVSDEDSSEDDFAPTKVNFPPFKHYILKDNEFVEVLRSHWKNGEFCVDGGKLTNRLAFMFLKLVERYSLRGNWRSYTYVDEMRSQALLQLSQIGLQFDESRSNTPNPFAYYTAAVTNSFTRILNVEKRNQNIRDDMLTAYGQSPSYTRQLENEYKMREMETKYRDDA